MTQQTASGLGIHARDLRLLNSTAAGSALPLLKTDAPLRRPEREATVRMQQILAPASRSRRKIWDFDINLHCSIIGTCLTNSDVRQVLVKAGLKECLAASEHDLHRSGVVLAGKRHDGAKLLNKMLDRRHRVAINQLARAQTSGEVRGMWQEAVRRGEIPGAYWAVLTHPSTDDALVREVFSEVHMLSHLVGPANRADIRRLRQLESEKTELEHKVVRQQRQLQDAVVAREATIRELRGALEERLPPRRDGSDCDSSSSDAAAWTALAADLKTRLTRSESRCERVERQLAEARSALAAEQTARIAAERRGADLGREIEAMEADLAGAAAADPSPTENAGLKNLTLLYVGGRPGQIGHLRALTERFGIDLLHHDGGVEERGGLLPGLVSRADAVMFPVDCVSHSAMSAIKRLCRQAAKPFVPLRGGGLAPFCAALRSPVIGAAKS